MLLVVFQFQNLPTTLTTANKETAQDVNDEGRRYGNAVSSDGYAATRAYKRSFLLTPASYARHTQDEAHLGWLGTVDRRGVGDGER